MDITYSTISRYFHAVEKDFGLHSHKQVMMVALVVNLWWKRQSRHLCSITGQLDALEANEALNAAINVNLNFASTFQESEQSLIAELKCNQVGWIRAVNVLVNGAFEDVVINLKFDSNESCFNLKTFESLPR